MPKRPTKPATPEVKALKAKNRALRREIKELKLEIVGLKGEWQRQYWRDYVYESGFKPYRDGKSLTIPLVGRLKPRPEAEEARQPDSAAAPRPVSKA